MESSFIRRVGSAAALECGDRFYVDLRAGAVVGRVDDVVGIGAHTVLVRREYDSRAAARPSASLGVGWSLRHEGLASARASHGVGSHIDVRLCGEVIASAEVTMRRARVCVRRFELSEGRLCRVRDERDAVIEEYEYDGPLLVAARTHDTPWRYFEYDDRGRRARCVRTWSATGARDRQITYVGRKAVVDDATGATWIVEHTDTDVTVIDPEMRRSSLAVVEAPSVAHGCDDIVFDASGAIAAVDVENVGRLKAKTDPLGRITELLRSDGERVSWRYERESTIAHATGRVGDGWLRAAIGSDGRILEQQPGSDRVGVARSIRCDEDGSVVEATVASEHAAIDNDREGRAVQVRLAGGRALTIVRDRAGRAVAVESEGMRRRIDELSREGAPPPDEIARSVIEGSACAQIASSPRDRAVQHVAVVLAHARALGCFAPPM